MFKVKDAERIEGLRISPEGVVEEKEKIRVVHDLTFDGPRSGAGGEPRRSVNEATAWEQVPGYKFGGLVEVILKHIIGLRAKFGVDARILIQMMDVKSAFRQVGMDPDGASRLA